MSDLRSQLAATTSQLTEVERSYNEAFLVFNLRKSQENQGLIFFKANTEVDCQRAVEGRKFEVGVINITMETELKFIENKTKRK